MSEVARNSVSFDKVITALLDHEHIFPPVHLHRFSDLQPTDLSRLAGIWAQINADRRLALLEDLENLAETDTLVSFEDLGKLALNDTDPRVREVATRLLWESEDNSLINRFLEMVDRDPDVHVRSAAATALGQFVYYGELEEIPERDLHRIEEKLLAVTTDQAEAKLLRRRALEAMGFSSRPEIKPLIRAAYLLNDTEWLVTALFAMGRSADSSWTPFVLDMLDSENDEVLYEAVRAAGELEAPKARKPILQIIKNQPEGSEVRLAGIWSLSKIGGHKVRETLEAMLEESEDDEETDILEDALENLEFTDGFNKFGMLDHLPNTDQEVAEWETLRDEMADDEDDDDEEDKQDLYMGEEDTED